MFYIAMGILAVMFLLFVGSCIREGMQIKRQDQQSE